MAIRWLTILSLVLFGGVWPAIAQGTPWTAWLYNANGTMTLVSSDGQILQELVLPTVPGQAYPSQVAVSRTGELVAYVTSNEQLNTHRLVIYNLRHDALQTDYVVAELAAHTLAQEPSPRVFNEGDTALAFGTAPLSGPWRIAILGTDNGSQVAELTGVDDGLRSLGAAAGPGVVPVIQYFQGREVAFFLRRSDDPTGAALGSYVWDIQTGNVRPSLLAGDFAFLPQTGELVMALADRTLPNSNGVFAGGQQNTLQVLVPDREGETPFYNSAESTLSQPHFIQNGERIMVASAGTDRTVRWRVLKRTGELVGEINIATRQLFPLADGFIYLTASNPPTLMVANTRDGIDAGVAIGQAAAGAQIQLAWAGDSAVPPTLSFEPWADLSDPVSAAPPTQVAMVEEAAGATEAVTEPQAEESYFFVAPTPVFLPTPASFQTQLTPGGRAVVTPEGHGAGLRIEPESEAPALILLYSGMAVEVLDGPLITDGYIWWQVRTEGERSRMGWAIEGALGAAWLVPASP